MSSSRKCLWTTSKIVDYFDKCPAESDFTDIKYSDENYEVDDNGVTMNFGSNSSSES